MVPTRSRLVGGRPQMPTQKVEVPRIHPPGTERVGDEAERPTFPPARLPPAAPSRRPRPPIGPRVSDLFNIADIDAFDIPLAPEGSPVSGPRRRARPRRRRRSRGCRRARRPSFARAFRPRRCSCPSPSSPSTEVSFEMDAEIPASVVDDLDEDTWDAPSAPPKPPSMPALPRATAPAPAVVPESARVVDVEPAPAAEPEAEADEEPSVPTFAIPSDVAPEPVWTPPAPSEAPAPPVFAPVAPPPPPAPLYSPPPIAPPVGPPAYLGEAVAAAPPPPSNLAKWKIMGASIVAAAAIVTGGQIYLAKLDRTPDARRAVPAILVPTPVAPTPVVAVPAVVDASTAMAADVAAVAVAAAVATATDAAVDGGVDGATGLAADATADVAAAARPAVVVDASAPAPGSSAGWDVAVFGASNDPPRDHPRRRDMDHLEAALEPEVRRCVGPTSSRHVRMTVVYEGSTGHPRSLRIVGSYSQPPVGTCLESVIRSHPTPPFTDAEFESNFVFSTNDED